MMKNDSRNRLAAIFRDTQQFYNNDPILKASVESSCNRTIFYDADKIPAFSDEVVKSGEITVTKSRSYEAAIRLSKLYPGKKITVLNFASATNPGGGVINGSSAQEESLYRCSTLYPTLNQKYLWQNYYDVNRIAKDVLHTDACIYSPGIVICKTDTDYPERMPQEKWITVDVISCAAPNLRSSPTNQYNPECGQKVSLSPVQLQRLHESRARSILAVCAANGADILVLGTFGCGAFRNNPAVVAKAYANVLKEYHRCFDVIEFAVYCRNFETENYDAFVKEFEI